MKIHLTKRGMTRQCQDYEKELLESAGWTPVAPETDSPEQAKEEIIRLKPSVKYKATVKALDEANNQGDE